MANRRISIAGPIWRGHAKATIRPRRPHSHVIGRQLLAAFEHIAVVSLRRSHERVAHMRDLLEGHFGLSEARGEFTMVPAVDCAEYGRWGSTPWLRENSDAHGGRHHAWWLQSRTCRPAEQDRTSCLGKEMLHCRHVGSLGSRRNCGEVCSPLSMVNALQRFVSRNSTQRMLILEDDVCPTVALRSMRLLAELATRPWSLAKLGHCYGGDLSEGSCDATSKASQQAVRRSRPTLRDGLGWSFCAHALGVDRMAARRLIALAFPVPMAWDDLLLLLSGQWRERASSLDAGLRRIGLRSATALGAVHTSHSLFAQLSRGSNASFNSTIRSAGEIWRSSQPVIQCVSESVLNKKSRAYLYKELGFLSSEVSQVFYMHTAQSAQTAKPRCANARGNDKD